MSVDDGPAVAGLRYRQLPGGRDRTSGVAVADSLVGRRCTSRAGRFQAVLLAAGGSVGAELVELLGPVLSRLQRRRLLAVPGTAALLLLMGLLTVVPSGGRLRAVVSSVSAVSADLPWWQAMLRLPGSILVPASNLPVWGAFVQVAVVAAAAESLIGWRRMMMVGLVANAAATAGARVMAWLGPRSPCGISADVAAQLDTGPSVLITAVVIYLAVVHRAPIVGSLVAVMMVGEVVINSNLAGREHLIGMATAAGLACAARWRAHLHPAQPVHRLARTMMFLPAAALLSRRTWSSGVRDAG